MKVSALSALGIWANQNISFAMGKGTNTAKGIGESDVKAYLDTISRVVNNSGLRFLVEVGERV